MSEQIHSVVIVGREGDRRISEPVATLTDYLTKAGVKILEADHAERADLIVAIGGDGTMLYASRLARETDTPILGINRGRLGFLADVTPDDMLTGIESVLRGDFSTESRLLIEIRLVRESGEENAAYALNDVVLQRRETGRMVDVETHIDGKYVNTHAGDGLIVATPTGSTAYALSCGGPIIEPNLDAVVVVPICPHTLTDRPVVVSADKQIEVRLLQRNNTKAEITVDGFSMGDIQPQDRLLILAANKRVRLVHPPGYDFYSILRSKLFWGRDNRRRDN